MAEVIDEQGRLLGLVNVIDAAVPLLLVAVTIAVASLVLTPAAPSSTTVTVETGAPGYVVDAINASEHPADDVAGVRHVDVRERYRTNVSTPGYERTEYRIRLAVDLETAGDAEVPTFRGQRLYVGREVTLDLGTTVVTGDVVRVDVGDDGGGASRKSIRAHSHGPALLHGIPFQYGENHD